MSFDKEQYWKNRKAGKRGQGEPQKPKFFPKGEKLPYTTREGHQSHYANNEGAHLVKTNKGFESINRKQARQKLKDRNYTQPGFKGHEVNPPKFKGPSHPPHLSNKARLKMRRKAALQKEREGL